ncbi:MAG: TIGR03986 family CRISPR-associated RAMP protein [Bacteroidia bacterium]|nr:TIGR03986 family CRISPR-associated RAMP protein [Bacteroidia bacterium]
MKTAKLIKQGKGWQLVGEKTLTVQGDFGLTEDMNGQEVEFDNTGGPVKLIRFNGKDYTKHQTQQRDMAKNKNFQSQHKGGSQGGFQQQGNRDNRGGGNQGPHRDPARAPYNFVPLNELVMPAEAGVDFDSYAEGRLSGYIDLEIEALTDVFIRGELEKFFTVNGEFAIPGSSLRGLIRSLVEIASYSRMEMVEKKRKFFFRNISDDYFKDIFLDIKGNDVRQKSKAGWLSKQGSEYYLQEAPAFYKVNRNALKAINLDWQDEVYKTNPIWFDSNGVQKIHQKQIKNREGRVTRTLNLHYNKLGNSGISKNARTGWKQGTLLVTGLFGSSKHFQWIIPSPQPNAQQYRVTDLMQEYQMDENRDEKADLIKALQRAGGQAVPCFFIPDASGKPVAVGHTGIFRHPYQHTIGHAVKQDAGAHLDVAKSLFGFADTEGKKEVIQAGKVFFEDAFATEKPQTEFGALKILSSPKPTSFQLYIEQPKDVDEKNMHHWGTDNHKIRGHKLYWHSKQNWRNPEVLVTAKTQQELILNAFKEKNTQYTVGEVLKSGAKFSGRIRFDNLSPVELGALLLAMDLPDGCAHKLGMGKSLGMGSVQIRPTLKLINRKNRYEKLFDSESSWSAAYEKDSEMASFKNAFATWIGPQTGKLQIKSVTDYWAQDGRMQELRHLLTFEHQMAGVSWENRTRYMLIEHPTHEPKNEYRDKYTRHVLPKPSEVVKPDTYNNP